jgi:hypothetical protein
MSGKIGLLFDTLIGLIIVIIGLVLLSTSLQGRFSELIASISGTLQVIGQ